MYAIRETVNGGCKDYGGVVNDCQESVTTARLSNEDVVDAFVRMIEGLSLRGAQDLTAELLGGDTKIDHQTISNYRTGKWKRLDPPARRKLERILDLIPAKESPTYAEGVRFAIEKMEASLAELRGIVTTPSKGDVSAGLEEGMVLPSEGGAGTGGGGSS